MLVMPDWQVLWLVEFPFKDSCLGNYLPGKWRMNNAAGKN